jgi:hypothetical protein
MLVHSAGDVEHEGYTWILMCVGAVSRMVLVRDTPSAGGSGYRN